MFYSVKELMAELRKPGKVEADVNTEHDVYCILIEKSDLLSKLKDMPADSESPWILKNVGHADGTRRLSIISDFERETCTVEELKGF